MSDYLPTTVLDQIAAAMDGFNDQTCVVRRPPTTKDAAGQLATGALTTIATVPCRVEPAGARAIERIAGPNWGAEADHIIPLARGTSVQNDDTIDAGGQTYHVVYAPTSASNQAEIPVLVRHLKAR